MKFVNLLKPRTGTGQMSSEQMPGHPQGDTAALVPVIAVTEDMLVTRDGAFVIMLEMPPLDIGFAGQDFGRWTERYQMALDRLPAGTAFQMTVLLEPHDPMTDLKYFLDRAKEWEDISHQGDLPQRKQTQARQLRLIADDPSTWGQRPEYQKVYPARRAHKAGRPRDAPPPRGKT